MRTSIALILLPLAAAQVSQIADGQIQGPAANNPNAQGPAVIMISESPAPAPATIVAPVSPPAITAPAQSAPAVEAPSAAPPAASAAPVEAPSSPIEAPIPASSPAVLPAPIAETASPAPAPITTQAPAPIIAPSTVPAPAPVFPINNGTGVAAPSGAAPSGFATGTSAGPAETSTTTQAPITPAFEGGAAVMKVQMGIWAVVGVAFGVFVMA
ncbi:MAG: hypothetical protein Q9221_004258 [Calogaya cf. arnoldii]